MARKNPTNEDVPKVQDPELLNAQNPQILTTIRNK